jgi:asparagine synthase (glutamine-hydrolysing)
MAWFDDHQRDRLYTDAFRSVAPGEQTRDMIGTPWRLASGADVLDTMLEVDATTYLPGDLITKIDIATMAHGLEARSPLLDHELMEFAASIPAGFKVRGREKKWILREALRGWLPDDILDRPKQGFTVPVGTWFRNELHEQLTDVLLDRETLGRGYFRPDAVQSLIARHRDGVADESKRLWALFMLELWHREFVDGAAAPAVLGAVA